MFGMFDEKEKRVRAPNWQLPERELLLNLVEEHYHVIECKKLDGATLKRKDAEWALMARKYNARTSLAPRTDKVLRCQWTAMRKIAKKDEAMRQENGEGPHTKNPLHDRIVRLIQTKLNETSNDSFDYTQLAMQDDDSEGFSLPSCSKENKEQKFDTSTFDSKEEIKAWDVTAADDSDGEHEKSKVFSARDCRLLLHCVRQEKNVLFTNSPLIRKQKAWSRIAQTFNRQSPTNRSPIELKKKFINLKSMASRVNNVKKSFSFNKRKKYEELSDDGLHRKIKSEPKFEGMDDIEFGNDDDDDKLVIDLNANHDSAHSDVNYDPLSNGVGGDSESGPHTGTINHSETKKVDKLKMDLLNYELETAKLQRKRIEDAIESEKSDRDLRALETSLRIRAARLEVLAAESKIPPSHPALAYTSEEMRAQQYLTYRIT